MTVCLNLRRCGFISVHLKVYIILNNIHLIQIAVDFVFQPGIIVLEFLLRVLTFDLNHKI